MDRVNVLDGKWLLIVDDEPDVLETLTDILDRCRIDTASTFESAETYLLKNSYDAAVLDIMGVDGYRLLDDRQPEKHPGPDAHRTCPLTGKPDIIHQQRGPGLSPQGAG